MKNSEIKPVRCRCGGKAEAYEIHFWGKCYVCECMECGLTTKPKDTEAEAITAWNRAMGERTAKVLEHDASITDTDGYKYHRTEYLCGGCKKKVLGGDDYCSHCGSRLIWGEDDE